jgi:hypothetical protein
MGCESQAKRRRAHEAHDAEDEKRRDIRFPPVETRIGHGVLHLAFVANNLRNLHG